ALGEQHAPRVIVVPPTPNRVRHTLRAQALLGLAHHRDLREVQIPIGSKGPPFDMGSRRAVTSLRRNWPPKGKAWSIAARASAIAVEARACPPITSPAEDVRDVGLEVLVHQELTLL